ncbi:hypothetical protein [Algoriella sp.]|uniref:hypothetical protein n=1 Tax=Algoriella sp. TaxID=1872434 RepID=UPI002FCAED20
MNSNKLKYILSIHFFILSIILSAQFVITESFKNSAINANVIKGNNAILTAGNVDVEGDGWLRLTSNTTNQKGFAYINETFPSEQGVTIEFDYKTWGGNGADGFTVFLFDGTYSSTGTKIFATGAYGGALGYAKSNSGAGMTGGYIGIGFDEYGNYASTSEGKNGGAGPSLYKNYISLRGIAPDYKYIFGKQYSSGIAYSKTATTRPTDALFYRRVKVEITPEGGSYRIKTFLKNSLAGAFVEQFSTISLDKPFKTLKVGFAGSTGGSTNYHEIRNVTVKTPGGISVKKSANKTHLSESATVDMNKVTYTIEVSNFQSATVPDISFIDILQDANGNQLTPSQFIVESISLSGFIDNSSSLLQNVNNKISGTLGLERYKDGIVTVVGKYVGAINGNRIKNTVSVNSVIFEDDNLANNSAFIFTDILKANNDLFKWNNKNLLVLTNDTYDGLATPIILSGATVNSTLSQVGTWPSGITLNTVTGEVVVVNGTVMPVTPLQYQLCTSNGTCSIATISFFDAENDISISGIVKEQCGYDGNISNYILTVTNNLPYVITTSASEKIQITFNVENGLPVNDKIESFISSLGDNSNWNIKEEYRLSGLIDSNDYIFTLNNNVTIPAFGTVTLQFSKNWNKSFDLGENNINSLNIDLKYLDGSNANIDKKRENNTLFISVFRLKATSVPTVSTKKVDQGQVITVGEAANLGLNTSGYKFYLNDGVTEIFSNYIIPTATNQPFSFKYKSTCDEIIVNVDVNVDVGFPNPGTITLDTASSNKTLINNLSVCYDSTVTVFGLTDASSGLLLFNYYWEISYDNGVTWLAEADSGSTTSNGKNSVTISNVTNTIKVRRRAKPISVDSKYAYSNEVTINAQQNDIKFSDGINSFAVQEYVPTVTGSGKFTIPNTITTTLASDIVIRKSDGTVVNPGQELTGLTAGEHEFTVTATTKSPAPVVGCVTTTKFKLIVYSLANCNVATRKIFATHQQMWTSGLSGVSTPERAVNGDRSQYATITGGVVLLGIGTVGVDLYFTKPDGTLYSSAELKGKKVTVKIGEQYSGLKVAGGLSVVGRNATSLSSILGTVPPLINSGFSFGVKGGVLDALKGDNVFAFSFVPSESNGTTVPFNGIRIQLGSLIGVADLATLFYAYIEEDYTVSPTNPSQADNVIKVSPPSSLQYPTEQRDVDGSILTGIKNTDVTLNKFVDDVTWGNRSEVLNVASGLSSVIHPYYAVDDNYDSYTLFNATAGVLNQQFLRTHLRQVARPGDQIQITLAYPNVNVVNLSLLQLGNFKVVYYLGETKVGEELMEKFRILDIGLFNFRNKRRSVISTPIKIPFDSFEIQQFNAVSVNLGDGLHVHDVRVSPMMLFEGQKDPKEITYICAADFLGIQNPDYCTDYEISVAKILQYGDAYTDANGTTLVDKEGNQIRMITQVEDIPNSSQNFVFSHFGTNVKYYSIKKLYQEAENASDGVILIKIQTKRQGSNYGDPQYLRVKLINCNQSVVNPIIKLNAK